MVVNTSDDGDDDNDDDDDDDDDNDDNNEKIKLLKIYNYNDVVTIAIVKTRGMISWHCFDSGYVGE